MKTNHTGFLLAAFAFMFVLIPEQVKAESFYEISFPAISSINFSETDSDVLAFKPVRAILNKKEAEGFLAQLGINISEKPRTAKWDPFKAARILQTSA